MMKYCRDKTERMTDCPQIETVHTNSSIKIMHCYIKAIGPCTEQNIHFDLQREFQWWKKPAESVPELCSQLYRMAFPCRVHTKGFLLFLYAPTYCSAG